DATHTGQSSGLDTLRPAKDRGPRDSGLAFTVRAGQQRLNLLCNAVRCWPFRPEHVIPIDPVHDLFLMLMNGHPHVFPVLRVAVVQPSQTCNHIALASRLE